MLGRGFRDPDRVAKAVSAIRELGQMLSVMHVCGTHQDTLVRFGLEPMLRSAGMDTPYVCCGLMP